MVLETSLIQASGGGYRSIKEGAGWAGCSCVVDVAAHFADERKQVTDGGPLLP